MADTLRITSELIRLAGSAMPAKGGIPRRQVTVMTDSNLYHQSVQVVGTAHVALEAGDVTDEAMAFLDNASEEETIEVGLDESTTFLPLFEIPPGRRAELPIISSLANTFVRSSTAGTPLEVSLYKIVAPS